MSKPESIGSPEEWRRLADQSTVSMRPSGVFALRLAQTRKDRGLTQAQLARRLADKGVPFSSRAIRAVERGERRLSLDEALAIALELQAVPAWMLTPPESSAPEDDEGIYVRLTDDYYIDGAAMRQWLRSGIRSPQEPPTSDARRDSGRDRFQDNLALLALALVDAWRGRAGVGEAVDGIIREVKRRERELAEEETKSADVS